MKINNLCELLIVYNGILDFFIDSGYGEQPNLTPHPTLNHFIDSYSQLDNLLLLWKANCSLQVSADKP
jgi:hypothetical protein